MNEGDEVMLNSSGGVNWADDPTSEMAGAGGVHEDKLVMMPPVQGVLDRDVSHTLLYYGPRYPPTEKKVIGALKYRNPVLFSDLLEQLLINEHDVGLWARRKTCDVKYRKTMSLKCDAVLRK